MKLVHLFCRENLPPCREISLCASMLESACAIFVRICLCLLCFGVMKLINGTYFIYPEGKNFTVYVRYFKMRTAMTPEWLTIKQSGSQKCFTKERNSLMMNMPGVRVGLP